MPGTILLDDYRDQVEQQLRQHITNLTSGAQQAASAVVQPVQAIGQGLVQAPQQIQQGAQQTVQSVQDALNAHIDQLTQGAQQAVQSVQQQAQPAVQVLGGAKDQVEQALNAHIDTLGGGPGNAFQNLGQPTPTLGAPATGVNQPVITSLGGPPDTTTLGAAPAVTNAPAPDRSMSLKDYARAAAQRAGIDPEIFVAQIQQESGFTPTAKSPAGAIGIAQFMPDTARGVGVDPTDPYASLDAAAKLDAQNLQKYQGDYAKALAAYNAGGGAVDKYGGVPPYKETQSYVNTILTNARAAPVTTAQARSVDLGYQPPKAALPSNEEPATAGDVHAGELGNNWKTQFDFGATYTGDYRTGTPHRGVDLVPSNGKGIGTEVDAFAPGTVSNIFRDSGAGGLIVYVQDQDGLTHAYMHLDHVRPGLKVGDQVVRGTPIAAMGESGTEGSPHLHYEVRKNAGSGDPLNQLIDPRPYLAGAKQPGGTTATASGNAPVALGGTRTGQNPVINVPGQTNLPVVMGAMQDSSGRTVADQPQSLGDQIGAAIQKYVQDAVQQVTNQAQQTGGAVVNAVQAVPSNLGRDTERLRGEVGGELGAAAQDVSSAAGNAVQAAAPVLGAVGGALEDFGRNGPIGATRGALQAGVQSLGGALEPSTRETAARELGAAGQRGADVIEALGIGPLGAPQIVRGGSQIAEGLLSQPSALDAIQTASGLTQKYPLDRNGLLPDINAMTDADRQRYLQAMMVLGTTSNPIEGRTPEPTRELRVPGAPEPPREPVTVLGPRGEVLSTVRSEAPPATEFTAPTTAAEAIPKLSAVEGLPGVTRRTVQGAEPEVTSGFTPPRTPTEGRVTRTGPQQRVSPEGEVLTQTTGQPTAAEGAERAGNILLPKFVQGPVRDIIEQVAAADPARFEQARRGVVTDQMVRDLADEAGTDVNRIAAAWKPGRAANAETVLALRTALADRALRVRSAQNLLKQNPSSLDARNTLIEALNQHAALQEVVSGVTAEAGRSMRQFRQPVTGEEAALSTLQRMAKQAKMTPQELTEHLANVDLRDPASVASLAKTLVNYTFADKAQAIWYFMLLSNPVTYARNAIGNAMVLATRPVESLAAAGVDAARADLTGTARQRFFGESPAEMFGGLAASGDALKGAFRTLRTGLTPQDLANPEFAGRRIEPFQGRLANLTVNAPGRILQSTDILFRTLNQGASMYQQAYRQAAQEGTKAADVAARVHEIVRNPNQELIDRAAADAAYRVFQNKNELATAVGKVREALPMGTGRFVLPFINTPINVGAYALERSPLGLAKLGRARGGELSDTIGRATLGTALAGYIATQAAQGNVTGAAPTDPTERDAWQREGKTPYSIKVGETWYSYAPLQPFSSIIAAGAAAGDAWRKGQDDPTSGLNPASLIAVTGVAAAGAMVDQPWLQGMSGLVDALTSTNDVQQQADPLKAISLNAQRALASTVVPAGVRQLARMFDPTVRTSDPGWEGFGQQIAAGVPGLSQNAPARLNAFGQPAQRPTAGLAALNPFNPSQETNDPVEKELRRLQDGGYDVEPNLVSNRVTLLSEALKLTPNQQRQYQAMAGTMTHDLLGALMETDGYRNLRNDQQALVINRLSDRVADAARKTLYPSLLDQAVEQKIQQAAQRQQTAPPDWLIRQASGSAEAATGVAPTGSANRTLEPVP